MTTQNDGLLIVISGPSGAGKGTIYNKVLDRLPRIRRSVSVTTRAPRAGEIDGVHYHFRTIAEYQQMIAKGDFLETAEVYCNYYGTPKAPVFKMLESGDDVMFEVDIYGAKQIKKKYPSCVSIFVMTPDFKVLEERLTSRKTETAASLKTRLSSARRELAEYECFDYIVFNDDADRATQNVVSIIESEKSKISRNSEKIKKILKV